MQGWQSEEPPSDSKLKYFIKAPIASSIDVGSNAYKVPSSFCSNKSNQPTGRKEEAPVFVCVVLSFRLVVFFLGGLSLYVCPEPVSANDIAPEFLY
eukprot:COSAG06_NODE_4384_length_4313_cov_1.652112_1_plen_96_part_00